MSSVYGLGRVVGAFIALALWLGRQDRNGVSRGGIRERVGLRSIGGVGRVLWDTVNGADGSGLVRFHRISDIERR